jgi:hypothetical protein
MSVFEQALSLQVLGGILAKSSQCDRIDVLAAADAYMKLPALIAPRILTH